MNEKKVMFFSDCFYPSKERGGATISMTNLAIALGDKINLTIVSTIFEAGYKEKYANVSVGKNKIFNADVYYLEDKSFPAVTKLIEEIKPDVIYVSSLFSFNFSLPVLFYKKKHQEVKVIIAPRGELITNRIEFHSFKKKPFLVITKLFGLYKNVYFHSTDEMESEEIHKNLSIPKQNIIKIPNLCLVENNSAGILKKEAGSLKITTVSRIHQIKNIHKAIEYLYSVNGDVEFNIYGNIDGEEYWNKCKELIKNAPENIKVNYKGVIEHSKIGEAFEGNHIFLSPTQSENYGHSIVEALIHAKPIIISTGTPWTDINESGGGYAISLDKPEEFVAALQEYVDMDDESYQKASGNASHYIEERLNTNGLIDEYIEFLK